jgi:hypothetical protein
LGTEVAARIAPWKRSHASGPSIISRGSTHVTTSTRRFAFSEQELADVIYFRRKQLAAKNANEQTPLLLVRPARDIRFQARPCRDTNNEHESNPDAEQTAETSKAAPSSGGREGGKRQGELAKNLF